jgi:5-methyltetrahydrofolate--homocysteine methyltransferase
MRRALSELLATNDTLLADGATGTNYFTMGLAAGEPPEFWNSDSPEKVVDLHRRFVDAGADIILTNTFGCNRHRLKLHRAESRVFELAERAALLASGVADGAERPVIVAGSVGPTGELFDPLGAMTHHEAIDTFAEQIAGLKAGGADVAWIETMSSVEEVRAAALGAIEAGLPYTATCSFDTAGRTMMGVLPADMVRMFDGLPVAPVAFGANCGVGAADIVVTLQSMRTSAVGHPLIAKGNCGIPHFVGAECVYTGTPRLMAHYAKLVRRSGARIVGGCCGTSPAHIAAMRQALDQPVVDPLEPSMATIVEQLGALTNAAPPAPGSTPVAHRRSRRQR